MQVDQASVLYTVYRAVDSVNQTLPADRRLEKSPATPLHEALDSLGLVNFVVETEMMIEEDFGQLVNLADQNAAAQGAQVFATVGSFAAYIESLLTP